MHVPLHEREHAGESVCRALVHMLSLPTIQQFYYHYSFDLSVDSLQSEVGTELHDSLPHYCAHIHIHVHANANSQRKEKQVR